MNISQYVGAFMELEERGNYLRLIGSSEPPVWYREEEEVLVWVEHSENLEATYQCRGKS
tara:strand:+ start:671 stop:847 length:177 start_codon:yes stop_codon:yes gene_type:complete